MKTPIIGTVLLAVVTAWAADPCQQYYGNGYCTDYVNSKLRTRVRGDAETWPANTPVAEVRPGDVAIFRREGHVAWVERVVVDRGRAIAIDVSEQNFGSGWVNRECRVTTNFGKTTFRKGVPLARVDGVYREATPTLIRQELPGAHANSTPQRTEKPPQKK